MPFLDPRATANTALAFGPSLVEAVARMLGGGSGFHAANNTPWGSTGVMPGADVPAASVPALQAPLNVPNAMGPTGTYTPSVNVGGGVRSGVNPDVPGWGSMILRSLLIPQSVSGSYQYNPPGPLAPRDPSGGTGGRPPVSTPTSPTPSGVLTGASGGAGYGAGPAPKAAPAPTFTYNLIPHVKGMSQKDLTRFTTALLATQNIDYKALSKTARKGALATVKSQVGLLRGQQASIDAQALRMAQQTQAANNAVVQLNKNLPSTLQGNYDRAAATIAGLTGGYAGQLGQIAQQQADQITQQFGPGSAVTSTGTDLGALAQSAQNTANFGGQNAMQSLVGQGVAAANQQLASNKVFEGTGLQGFKLALASGANQAAQLDPEIARTIGSLPSLTSQNLAALVSAATKTGAAREKALVDAFKLSGLSPADVLKANTQIDIANEGAQVRAAIAAAKLAAGGTGAGTVNKANVIDTGPTNSTGYIHMKDGSVPTDSAGNVIPIKGWVVNPKTGGVVKLVNPTPKKQLTPTGQATARKDFTTWLRVQRHGVYTQSTDRSGRVNNYVKQAPVSAQQAWSDALLRYGQLIRADPSFVTVMLIAFQNAWGGRYTIDRTDPTRIVDIAPDISGPPVPGRPSAQPGPDVPGSVNWVPPTEPAQPVPPAPVP